MWVKHFIVDIGKMEGVLRTLNADNPRGGGWGGVTFQTLRNVLCIVSLSTEVKSLQFIILT